MAWSQQSFTYSGFNAVPNQPGMQLAGNNTMPQGVPQMDAYNVMSMPAGTSFTTHTPELSHHTSPSISATTETVTTTTTERLSVKSSATTNTLHPKPTEAEETARTTGKSTEPSSISDLHIALISSAAGIIAVISVLIFVAYIVRLRTKANNRYKGSAATGVGMQEVTSHPSNGENQAGQEESPDETYAELNTGTYYNDHVYSVPT